MPCVFGIVNIITCLLCNPIFCLTSPSSFLQWSSGQIQYYTTTTTTTTILHNILLLPPQTPTVMDIKKKPFWTLFACWNYLLSWPGTQETKTHCAVLVTQHIHVDPNKKSLFSINGERNHVVYVCVQHFDTSCEGSNSAKTVRWCKPPHNPIQDIRKWPTAHVGEIGGTLQRVYTYCSVSIEVCNFKKAAMPHPGMLQI